MLVNKENKVAIMEVPKTGTTSLRSYYIMIRGAKDYNFRWAHANLNDIYRPQLLTDFGLDNWNGYTFYAIARCPVKRFLSSWRHCIYEMEDARTGNNEHPHPELYDEALEIFHNKTDESRETKVDPSLSQFIDACEQNIKFPTWDLASSVTKWINMDTALLNIEKMDTQFAKICKLLEIPVPAGVMWARKSDAPSFYSSVTSDEVNRIKKLLAADYDLYKRKGVTFSGIFYD